MTHCETKDYLTINLEDNMQFGLHESMPNYFHHLCYISGETNLQPQSIEKGARRICGSLSKRNSVIQTKFSRENRPMIINHQ